MRGENKDINTQTDTQCVKKPTETETEAEAETNIYGVICTRFSIQLT